MDRRIGVTVGKFNPPHLGHLLLIETAAREVDHLYVVLGDRPDQTIPARDRQRWLSEASPENVSVVVTPDDIPDASEPWARRTLEVLPESPKIAFTSEAYGPSWAEAMGIEHQFADPDRGEVPISASAIRNDLRHNFDFLVPPARAALARRVVVAGAESTGKTTLADDIAEHYKTAWVPEYGRTYWEGRRHRSPEWSPSEFVEIAKQHQAITEGLALQASSGLVVSDTDALVTTIWMRRYLDSASPELDRIATDNLPDLYLVTAPDFDWVQDGTRESESYRRRMHQWTLDAIDRSGVPHVTVSGHPETRLRQAVAAIEPLLHFPKLV